MFCFTTECKELFVHGNNKNKLFIACLYSRPYQYCIWRCIWESGTFWFWNKIASPKWNQYCLMFDFCYFVASCEYTWSISYRNQVIVWWVSQFHPYSQLSFCFSLRFVVDCCCFCRPCVGWFLIGFGQFRYVFRPFCGYSSLWSKKGSK